MPAGPPLSWEIPLVAFGHAVLFAIVTVARCSSGESGELFKPDDAIQVALSGPIKNETRMPQKAERAPELPKAAAAPPDVKVPPPPPNASDMTYKTPEAPKPKGDPNASARQKAMDALKRDQAMQDLMAPVGTENRAASNPDGGDGTGETTDGVYDPALAKWTARAREKVGANWNPLPSVCAANPGLVVTVLVDVDAAGNATAPPTVKVSSGNVSFDGAARRAVEMTPNLGQVPTKYVPSDGLRGAITFKAKECQ